MKYYAEIKKSEARIVYLHKEIHRTFGLKNRSYKDTEAWQNACGLFKEEYDRLCFINGFYKINERLRSGVYEDMEYAVDFVEIRPYFFRSGYMYKYLIRHLKKSPLPDSLKNRFEIILKKYEEFRVKEKIKWDTSMR